MYFQTSMMQPLMFGNGYVITFQTLLGMCLLIHTRIKVNSCQSKVPLVDLLLNYVWLALATWQFGYHNLMAAKIRVFKTKWSRLNLDPGCLAEHWRDAIETHPCRDRYIYIPNRYQHILLHVSRLCITVLYSCMHWRHRLLQWSESKNKWSNRSDCVLSLNLKKSCFQFWCSQTIHTLI